MDAFYPFFISFFLIFLSELGDKTQLLVLSFSNKLKAFNILLGVAIGTFFSHGLAILFGSKLASLDFSFSYYLSIATYLLFLLFGIFGIIKSLKRHDVDDASVNKHSSFLNRISNFRINYVFIIILSIFIGEIGDKTFLASLGLGLEYPNYKLSLILGSIFGMIASNSIAIFLGKFLFSKFNKNAIEFVSNLMFIVFGIFGFLNFFFNSH